MEKDSLSIVHNDELYYINIRNYLIHRAHAVRVDANRNLLSIAVLSEDFYAAFLNALLDLQLENANASDPNAKGIDLIDWGNRVAVQVSVTCTPDTIRRKIRSSIKKFYKPEDEVWQFYFVPITDEAPKLKTDIPKPEDLYFDIDHDVLDITRLLVLASEKHKLKELSQLVDQYSTKDEPSSSNSELKKYLKDLLNRTRRNHPSFVLLKNDKIDEQLYPGIKNSKQFEALGKIKGGSGDSGNTLPVWKIIRHSWTKGEKRNIVIEGEGGIGKTITLFSISESKDSPPAIYVPMHKLVNEKGDGISLSQYLQKLSDKYGQAILDLAASDWNEKTGPKLLILLDGFNEVPADKRREILHLINDWNDCPGAQLIAVSRPMDGMNLARELADDPIAITLEPLSRETAKEYLGKYEGLKIPPDESPLWEVLTLPLFLTLYRKTSSLEGQKNYGYSLAPKEAKGGGTLIWNYLQRELLKIPGNEDWVLRCAFACEFILPYIAFKMEQENRFTIERVRNKELIQEALASLNLKKLPHHLSKLIEEYEYNHDDDIFDLSDYKWNSTVLKDVELLKAKNAEFAFIHQHFRDALAGIWLVNQAEMMKDGEPLPEVWKRTANPTILDYAAELIEEAETARMWETNRKTKPTNHSATYAMLELQKRKMVGNDSLLNFSGMDLTGLSLTRYMRENRAGEKDIKLFRKEFQSLGTYFDESVFRSPGHESSVTCVMVLQDGRVVSGSGDKTLRVWDSNSGECLQTLKGHEDTVLCVTVFPDGRVVSGSKDATLRVWESNSGECLQTLEGHEFSVKCMMVLPDGRVVSGSDDETLRVWDINNGECLQTLKGHEAGVECMTVLPDGRVVSGSSDATLRVWDINSGECLQTLEGHESSVTCVAVLPDGRAVSGSLDRTLRVWDINSGECLQTLKGHEDCVRCMTVLPDGRVVSGSWDILLRVWDINSGECLQTLKGDEDGVKCMTVLPDGRVVSGSLNRTLRVWDSNNGECLQTLEGHESSVTCVTVLPDGRVVSGSDDETLRVWESNSGECLQTLEGHEGIVLCVTVLPDGRVVSGSYNNMPRVWDINSGECLKTLKGHENIVVCMTVLPDGRVVSGSLDHTLRVWESNSGECLATLKGHEDWVRCVTVLPDGRVVSGSMDNTLRVWDINSGECLQTLKGHEDWVRCVTVLPDGRVVSGSGDHTLRVWDSNSGECLQTLNGHKDSVACVTVLPDGRVVSGSDDKTLRVWDINNGECLQTLEGHEAGVECMTVLPDGRVVSGSRDRTLRVWDINSGECLQTLKGHKRPVACVTVLPDGRVVSGSDDKTLRVWESNSGECLQTLEGHKGGVECMTVLPDGRVVSGSDDKTLRVWDPQTGKRLDVWDCLEVDVSAMDFSKSILSPDLSRTLWRFGAKVPLEDEKLFVQSRRL